MPPLRLLDWDAIKDPDTTTTSLAAGDKIVVRQASSDKFVAAALDTLSSFIGTPASAVIDGGYPGDTVTATIDGGFPGDVVTQTIDGGMPAGDSQTAWILLMGGTAAAWAAAGDPVVPMRVAAVLIENGAVKGLKIGDDVRPWSQLPWLVEDVWTAAEKTKLAGIQTGAQVNPIQISSGEKSAGTGTALRGFAPADVKEMIDLFSAAASLPPVMSVAERTAGTLTSVRQMTPNDIAIMVGLFTPAGAVATVFGRTGAVTAQSGDYTADQITDTTAKVLMTPAERTKLAAYPQFNGVLDITASTSITAAAHRGRWLNVSATSVTLTVPSAAGFSAHDEVRIFAQGTQVTVARGATTVQLRRVDDTTGSAGPHIIKANGEAVLRRLQTANNYTLTGTLV